MAHQWFRRRLQVVEARRWDGTAENAAELIDWMASRPATDLDPEAQQRQHFIPDPTHPVIALTSYDHTVFAIPGEWLVRDPSGIYFAENPTKFRVVYEPTPERKPHESPAMMATLVSVAGWLVGGACLFLAVMCFRAIAEAVREGGLAPAVSAYVVSSSVAAVLLGVAVIVLVWVKIIHARLRFALDGWEPGRINREREDG